MNILGQFQFRRDTAANWTSGNPILLAGEMGIESDTKKFKIGDGTTAWNSLPYGGIKGDAGATGATGAAGVSPTVSVGATTVVTPATNPSVTDADAGANADLRFSLPRARAVAAGTTTTGAAGTSANVTSATDGNGDVSLNFTIPRGDTGATGATGPAANAFTNIAVSGQTTVAAEVANDTLTLVAGTGITLTTDAAADSVTITGTVSAPQNTFANVSVGTTPTPTLLQADLASDTVTINAGTGIVLTADAATDTMSIANSGVTSVAAGAGISVSAATGALTVTNTLPGYTTTTLNAPTASFSTAVTTVISQAIAGGSIAAGSMFQFSVRAQVINTIAASNLVCTISIGAVNVLVQTQAMGTTARAAPGGAVIIEGTISFSSATAAEATSRAFTGTAVAFDAAAATAAAVTVATAAATTADIKLNSSAATTTVIVREASLIRIK